MANEVLLLDQLPKNVLEFMMTFLSPMDVAKVSLTSKRLSMFAKSDYVWKAQCCQSLFDDDEFECMKEFQKFLEEMELSPPVDSMKVLKNSPWKAFFYDFNSLKWMPDHGSPDLVTEGPVIRRKQQGTKLWNTMRTSKGFSTGIHQWGLKIDYGNDSNSWKVCVGVCDSAHSPNSLNGGSWNGGTGAAYGIACWHFHLVSGSPTSTGESASPTITGKSGDVVTVILDCPKNKLSFMANGTQLNISHSLPKGTTWYPFVTMSAQHTVTLLRRVARKKFSLMSALKLEDSPHADDIPESNPRADERDDLWSVTFEKTQKVRAVFFHTEYSFLIHSSLTGLKYRLTTRFSELADFKAKHMKNDTTPFPEKNFFNSSESVIKERIPILEKWLTKVLNTSNLRQQLVKVRPLQKLGSPETSGMCSVCFKKAQSASETVSTTTSSVISEDSNNLSTSITEYPVSLPKPDFGEENKSSIKHALDSLNNSSPNTNTNTSPNPSSAMNKPHSSLISPAATHSDEMAVGQIETTKKLKVEVVSCLPTSISTPSPSTSSISIPSPPSIPRPSTPLTSSPSTPSKITSGPSTPSLAISSPLSMTSPKCASPGCKKKLALTSFQCKCGNSFCTKHRYAEQHQCDFDYKSQNKKILTTQNERVVCEKVQKI